MDKSLWSLIQVIECPIHGDVNIDAFYDQWEIDRFMEDDEGASKYHALYVMPRLRE